jgi:YfiH family protein
MPPPDWIVPQWPAPARVRSLMTTRNGGISAAPYASLNLGTRVGDDPAAVAENRARVRRELPAEPRWLKQVHGVTAVDAAQTATDEEADAAIARAPGVVCTIQVADCMPVLFCDRSGSCVGAAHAGWRGLSGGVLERTIEAMDVPPGELMAWLGPAIGPLAFEVGPDVLEAFADIDPRHEAFTQYREGKWLGDLFMLARRRLAAAGITSVHGGDLCTVSDPQRFFSHRRDRVTGRLAAFIWLA